MIIPHRVSKCKLPYAGFMQDMRRLILPAHILYVYIKLIFGIQLLVWIAAVRDELDKF